MDFVHYLNHYIDIFCFVNQLRICIQYGLDFLCFQKQVCPFCRNVFGLAGSTMQLEAHSQLLVRQEDSRPLGQNQPHNGQSNLNLPKTTEVQTKIEEENTLKQKQGTDKQQANSFAANSQNRDPNQAKLQEQQADAAENTKAKKDKKGKLKSSEPTEQDLCDTLLLIRRALPHRSLQKCIIRMFQSMQKKYQAAQHMQSNRQEQKNQAEAAGSQKDNTIYQGQDENDNSTQGGPGNGLSTFGGLVLPGRKTSCYHDIAAEIAAPSHEFYKNLTPTVEAIEALQKNITEMPILSMPKGQSHHQKLEQSAINSARKNNLLYFKQKDILKANFLNPHEQQKYSSRRKLAQIFIERGYGCSKAVDMELPPIEFERIKFRNLLGGVLTHSFRKLQSIMSKELRKTIKYLDRQQMRAVSLMLLNCRLKLEPIPCQVFFKIMKISFGLQDVTLSQAQAIECYNSILKLLKGKSITMQKLQKMGQIANRRNLQQKVEVLKQLAIKQKEKKNEKRPNPIDNNRQKSNYHAKQQTRSVSLINNIRSAQNGLWTAEIDRQLANLYVQYSDLSKIKIFMCQIYSKLSNYSIEDFRQRIALLVTNSIRKISQDSVTILKRKPFLDYPNSEQLKLILTDSQAEHLRNQILKYGILGDFNVLVDCINSINQFLKLNYKGTEIYSDSQLEDYANVKLELGDLEEMIDLKSESWKSEGFQLGNFDIDAILKDQKKEHWPDLEFGQQEDLVDNQFTIQPSEFQDFDATFLQQLDFES